MTLGLAEPGKADTTSEAFIDTTIHFGANDILKLKDTMQSVGVTQSAGMIGSTVYFGDTNGTLYGYDASSRLKGNLESVSELPILEHMIYDSAGTGNKLFFSSTDGHGQSQISVYQNTGSSLIPMGTPIRIFEDLSHLEPSLIKNIGGITINGTDYISWFNNQNGKYGITDISGKTTTLGTISGESDATGLTTFMAKGGNSVDDIIFGLVKSTDDEKHESAQLRLYNQDASIGIFNMEIQNDVPFYEKSKWNVEISNTSEGMLQACGYLVNPPNSGHESYIFASRPFENNVMPYSVVPEASGLLAGLLVGAGIMRRERKDTIPKK